MQQNKHHQTRDYNPHGKKRGNKGQRGQMPSTSGGKSKRQQNKASKHAQNVRINTQTSKRYDKHGNKTTNQQHETKKPRQRNEITQKKRRTQPANATHQKQYPVARRTTQHNTYERKTQSSSHQQTNKANKLGNKQDKQH